MIGKEKAKQATVILPSNVTVFRCAYCKATFSYIPFVAPEKDIPQYYHRRDNPSFCPACGRPLKN